MGGTPFMVQDHFRVRSDTTAAENGTPVWVGNEDANVEYETDTTFRIRFVASNTGDGTPSNNMNLWCSHEGGTYFEITTTSSIVIATDASSSSDNEILTVANFELTAGTGTGEDGRYEETGVWAGSISAGGFSEHEMGLSIVDADVSATDTLDFRMRYTNSDTVFDTYSVTCRITVAAAASGRVMSSLAGAGGLAGTGGIAGQGGGLAG